VMCKSVASLTGGYLLLYMLERDVRSLGARRRHYRVVDANLVIPVTARDAKRGSMCI
jgi:hypothetical protein